MTTRTYPCCPHCDSPNVTADGALVWDVETQRWISADGSCYSKSGYCGDCDEEIRYFTWGEVPTTQPTEVPHA